MKFVALDIFAGCGGFSSGLIQAGHEVTSALEIDSWAAETYQFNHRNVNLLTEDITKVDSTYFKVNFKDRVNLVVGGPPCQGFSVSGPRQYGVYKKENALVAEYIRVIKAVEPEYFILENVRGFTTATIEGRIKALNFLLAELREIGYHVYHDVLQAADYGVPQLRSRLFVVGSRHPIANPFPNKTHSLNGTQHLRPYLSIMEAIGDLPIINACEGTDNLVQYSLEPQNDFQQAMRNGSLGVYNHEAMKHSARIVERFATIQPGGSGYKLGTVKGKDAPETVYKSNNQRLISDQPALCITANWQSSYIHPLLNRNLTVREAARIQTFPDSYVFKGKRAVPSASLLRKLGRDDENFLSQCHQVGNAVPPLLAKQIFERLSVAVEGVDEESSEQLQLWG
uniref:Cytosine-specific methyltransferase n=1 Tax=Brevibacillus brevis TaxID=1393 RepID=Q5D6Y6_BREBE|nr:BbvCI methyltransferase 2 [Brevibacillus brevis]